MRSGVIKVVKMGSGLTNSIFFAQFIQKSLHFQIEQARKRDKSAFDHINTDWNLPHDDGSTDFSDEETMFEDRVSKSFFLHPLKLIFLCSN